MIQHLLSYQRVARRCGLNGNDSQDEKTDLLRLVRLCGDDVHRIRRHRRTQ